MTTCVDCGTATRTPVRGQWAGTLADFERLTWPTDELLGEWETLRDSGHTVARRSPFGRAS